jgi:hypothetical protein
VQRDTAGGQLKTYFCVGGRHVVSARLFQQLHVRSTAARSITPADRWSENGIGAAACARSCTILTQHEGARLAPPADSATCFFVDVVCGRLFVVRSG